MKPVDFSKSDPRKLLKILNFQPRSNISLIDRLRKTERILKILKKSGRYDVLKLHALTTKIEEMKKKIKDLSP